MSNLKKKVKKGNYVDLTCGSNDKSSLLSGSEEQKDESENGVLKEPVSKKPRTITSFSMKSFVFNDLDSENAVYSCRIGDNFGAMWCVRNSDLCSYCEVKAAVELLQEYNKMIFCDDTSNDTNYHVTQIRQDEIMEQLPIKFVCTRKENVFWGVDDFTAPNPTVFITFFDDGINSLKRMTTCGQLFAKLLNTIYTVDPVNFDTKKFRYEGDLTGNKVKPVCSIVCNRDIVEIIRTIYHDMDEVSRDQYTLAQFFGRKVPVNIDQVLKSKCIL